MFDFRNFVKRGLLDAVGRQPDYWVILNAAGYHEKGLLLVEDMEEIQSTIEAQYLTETEAEVTGGDLVVEMSDG